MYAISRVILFAKDMQVLQRFYEDVLGLTRINTADDSDGFITLDGGGIQLCLHNIPPAHAKKIEIKDPPVPRSDTPMKICFQVEDVEAVRAELQVKGVQVLKTMSSGSISFCDATDPEGNVIQISTRP